VISTAGLQLRDDRPFARGDADNRVFRRDTPAEDIVMSHISVNFDRTGYQKDLNVVFPIERLGEMATEKIIGSVATIITRPWEQLIQPKWRRWFARSPCF
jgi:D-proline reductase (dithiol) PrdB